MCRETPAVRPPAVSSWGHGCRDAPFDLPPRLPGRLQPGGQGRGRPGRRRRRRRTQPAHRAASSARKVRHFAEHLYGPGPHAASGASATGAKGEGRFARVTWDEALDLAAARWRRRASGTGGESILPVPLRRLERLAHPGRARRALLPPARRVAPRAHRLRRADRRRGHRASTARCPASRSRTTTHARLIVLWGVQPVGVGHPPRAGHPASARARGAQLVVIDPRRTPLARAADLHLALRPGTDLPSRWRYPLAVRERARRRRFSRRRTPTGGDELRARAAAWTFERAAREAGVAGRDRAASPSSTPTPRPRVIRCGWGLERNRNGGTAVAAMLALPAVARQVRRPRRRLHDEQLRGLAASTARRGAARQPPTRDGQHEPARRAR